MFLHFQIGVKIGTVVPKVNKQGVNFSSCQDRRDSTSQLGEEMIENIPQPLLCTKELSEHPGSD